VLLLLAAVPLPRRAALPRLPLRRADRRVRAAIPGLVDALAAALGSGLSLPLAFAEIAPTLAPPLAVVTRRVAAVLALGARVTDALSLYASVMPAQDLAPLVIVLGAFVRSGGRVGNSLERVAVLLRGRLALEEERAALTAQARVSSFVLVLLAPLGAVFFAVAMPDYGATLFGDGIGLLIVALVFEVAGAIWLWFIVRQSTQSTDLATFLDAVVVGLDAGLTFERALAGIVERVPTLSRGREARRLLADLSLGVPLPIALRAFATRPDEARVGALVAASARFGSPLARLLVVQADALRATERHRAEASARRLPILMLFPLALCILPALLVIFLGPPLVALLR
jgi:Flp pilus assembly protein TadB